jgi:hypothetical protein
MNLHELRTLVWKSSVDDWELIECLGPDAGPSYLSAVIGSGSSLEGVQCQLYRATYRPNISIGLAWGLSHEGEVRDFERNTFPDEQCYPTILDLLWNGSLVYRYEGLAVDGGRGALPYPNATYDTTTDPHNPVLLQEEVTEEEVGVWRIAAALRGDEGVFDRKLDQAHFVILRTAS